MGGLPLSSNPTLAVHAAMLATLTALATLAGLVLTTLMLLTGLSLSALLLLAGLTLTALLRVVLLLLRVARILLFVRHWDVLHVVLEAPRPTDDNPPHTPLFLAQLLQISTTVWKITRKYRSICAQQRVPPPDPGKQNAALPRGTGLLRL